MHFYCYLYILVLKQNMVGNMVITNWKYVGVQAVYAALNIRGGRWCIAVSLTGPDIVRASVKPESVLEIGGGLGGEIIFWFIIINITIKFLFPV